MKGAATPGTRSVVRSEVDGSTSERLIFLELHPLPWAPTFPSTYQPSQTPSLAHTPLPPGHREPLTWFLLSLMWDLHSHSQPANPIPYATLSLESALVSPGRNDLFPLQLPQNFVCRSITEISSFCLRLNPLPDFQGHLGQWPRLIHFGISILTGLGSCSKIPTASLVTKVLYIKIK